MDQMALRPLGCGSESQMRDMMLNLEYHCISLQSNTQEFSDGKHKKINAVCLITASQPRREREEATGLE